MSIMYVCMYVLCMYEGICIMYVCGHLWHRLLSANDAVFQAISVYSHFTLQLIDENLMLFVTIVVKIKPGYPVEHTFTHYIFT